MKNRDKMEFENRYCEHDLFQFTVNSTNVELLVLGYYEQDQGHVLGGNLKIHEY